MAESKRIGETELSALVAREISLARSDSDERRKKLTRALEYYQGTMNDIVAEEGRSSVVSRDVADVVGWIHPGILKVFTASPSMALCEPVGDEDEAFAKQATDGINYTFWKENDGYRNIYDATWDSLINGNGIVKVYWDDTPADVISYHSGLTDDVFTDLVADDEVEVLAHDEAIEMMADETGQQMPVTVHRVKIKRAKKGGRTCVEAIPPEDYGKDGDSKTCAKARFQYHRSDKTRSDLIKMGFDRTVVDAISIASDNNSTEAVARRDNIPSVDSGDKSTEVLDYYECFMLVDIDDDGIAEMCRVHYAGGEVLDWEVWEDEPVFYDIPCSPMPHRWEAQSVFDETEDVQRIKTVMLRQANDNTYATNNPQRFVTGKISNPEELFSPAFGGAVFGDSGSTVTPLTVPFVANHAYDALNYQDQVIQRRTGVSRQTTALDPGALVDQTATANQNESDASYSQVELLARNMAELGWAPVCKAILRTEVKHQDGERTIRMNRKPVKIDPRWWNTDMDVTIDVGLGTGSRDRDAAMLQNVLGNQVMITGELKAAFPDKALEMLPFVRKTLIKQGEAVGIRNIDSFYPEVTEDDIAAGKKRIAEMAQKPDPALALEQAKGQTAIEVAKANGQTQLQIEQGKTGVQRELEQIKAEGNVVKETAQMQADERIKVIELNNALSLQQQQIDSDERIKSATLDFERYKLDVTTQLEREKMASAAVIAASKPAPTAPTKGKRA